MELTFLHVADYANVTVDQKLNVMGIFGSITANSLPTVHPEMHIVAQLSANASEYGRHFKLSIKLLDEDASRELVSFNDEVTVPSGERGLPARMNFNLRLVNVQFESAGTYEVVVLVDGDQKGSVPLEIIHTSHQPDAN
jgi:hypothetical protein